MKVWVPVPEPVPDRAGAVAKVRLDVEPEPGGLAPRPSPRTRKVAPAPGVRVRPPVTASDAPPAVGVMETVLNPEPTSEPMVSAMPGVFALPRKVRVPALRVTTGVALRRLPAPLLVLSTLRVPPTFTVRAGEVV